MAMADHPRVVCLGPEFTFSHEASLKLYPDGELTFLSSFFDVFSTVQQGRMDFGVLPIENSSSGAISDSYQFLLNQDYEQDNKNVKVKIVAELILPVQHNLLASRPMDTSEIETLYTHPQPQLQCGSFLNSSRLQAKVVTTSSTAEAGAKALEDPTGACLGSQLLARELSLLLIEEAVQDLHRNATRFFGISSRWPPTSRQKTTFAMVIPDRAGRLVEALQTISNQQLNVKNIKTLPIHDSSVLTPNFKDWFVLDVDGSDEGRSFTSLLRDVEDRPNIFLGFKILGSYPAFGSGETNTIGEEVPSNHGSGNDPPDFVRLIGQGESSSVEFKSTLRFDIRQERPNKEMAKVVAKAVASFMNSDGGVLFIGIADDGTSLGLEHDLSVLQKSDFDGFSSALFQCIIDYIGVEFCQNIQPTFVDYDGNLVCAVQVTSSTKPAWVSDGGKDLLFIRAGNSSRPLDGKKALEYVFERFRGI